MATKTVEVEEEVESVEAIDDDEDIIDEDSIETYDSIEDVEDDEEELWPGSPTVGQLKAWKKEYGKIFVSSIDEDTHIVWRPINRIEYKSHIARMEQMNANGQLSQAAATMRHEEAIAALTILYPAIDPTNAGSQLAGIASLITQQVMDASGFVAMAVREL